MANLNARKTKCLDKEKQADSEFALGEWQKVILSYFECLKLIVNAAESMEVALEAFKNESRPLNEIELDIIDQQFSDLVKADMGIHYESIKGPKWIFEQIKRARENLKENSLSESTTIHSTSSNNN